MENFDIQTLSLLTTIVTLTATLLSISQGLQKNGFISSICGITLCILPVLFIQQILQFVYSIKFSFSILFLLISVFLLVFAIKNNHKNNLKFTYTSIEKYLPYASVIVSMILFVLQDLYLNIFIKNYNADIGPFIDQLNVHKISVEMYVFLSKNLRCTLFLLSDTITLILSAITLVYTGKYCYKKHQESLGAGSDIELDKFKYVIFIIISILSSFGCGKFLIVYVLNLF